ncbi:flagellar basal body rod C-terminal domain-containing protein [Microbulbifer sp. ALW1]|uniref:flagellar basal body rod C-terminal domain-containing protein n=1 Tax=Microbulbifer sp. (strain ALW1) TaxID=1516059 RepID=UPI00135B0180|nr:flagellar basal body rod C-terminal domain-containing protein [Microbulbifer sp. ALW1]
MSTTTAVDELARSMRRDLASVELSTFLVANAERMLPSETEKVYVGYAYGSDRLSFSDQLDSLMSAVEVPTKKVYLPDSSSADAAGYVVMVDVDVAKEFVDMSLIKRRYEAAIKVYNSISSMKATAREIGR